MAFYCIVEIYTILVFHFAPYNRLVRRWGEDNHQLRAFMENVAGKGISQYYLLQNGLDNKTLDSLKKGKNITLLTLEKLCKLIDCTPNDIIEFI